MNKIFYNIYIFLIFLLSFGESEWWILELGFGCIGLGMVVWLLEYC